MREILFRGKRKDDGEWVEGYYVKVEHWLDDHEMHIIIPMFTTVYPHCEFTSYDEVDPKTIGQFTGLLDANGMKIFEGDIVKTRRYETYTEELKGYYGYDKDGYPQKVPGYTGSMKVARQRTNDDYHAVVRYSLTHGFYLDGASVSIAGINNTVIGNIHDNPELLKR